MLKKPVLRTITYLAIGFTTPITTMAAIPDSATTAVRSIGSIDPAKIGAQLNPPPVTAGIPGISVPGFTPTPTSAAALKTQVVLRQIVVTGATVYGNEQLAALFRNYIGRRVSLADLQQFADTITVKYRKDGYILTRAIVPAQNITSGVVTIRVVEGYINQVDIQGDPKGGRTQLEKYAQQIMRARPINIAQLERYILLANDMPGMSVRAVLSPAQMPSDVMAPSEIAPGAANLTLIVGQHTADGYIAFDNRGTKFLGPNEISAGADVNSIFRSGDQTGIQTLLTPDLKELQYFNIYHSTPLGDNGAMLNLSSSYSHTAPAYTLEQFNVQGHSATIAAGVTYPVIRSRIESLFANIGVDALNSSSTILGNSLYNDHIRSIRAGMNYNLADKFEGVNQLGSQLSQGFPGLGSSGTVDISRPDGRSDYTKITANASRLQNLPHNFSILAAAQGQYAFTPLLSAEQFSFGGSQFGQAYDPSEITGDHGIAAKAELRLDTQPNWEVLRNVQYFAFYDIGKVWNINNNTGLPPIASAASTGFGLRSNFTPNLMGSVELAKPLTRDVATEGNKNPRIFFSISLSGETPSNTQALPLPPVQPAKPGAGLVLTKTTTVPAAVSQNVAPTNPQPTEQVTSVTPAPVSNPTPTPAPAPATSSLPPTPYEGLTPLSTTPAKPAPVSSAATADATPVHNTSVAAPYNPANKNGYYTLQLMSGYNISDLQRFAAAHNLNGKVNFIHTQYEGKDWYLLAYGEYASSSAAHLAKTDLPASLKSLNPWVRHVVN